MKFFQAFLGMDCKENLMEAFYHVEVERVLMSRSQKAVKIYIIAEELIQKNKLREMEFQLKRQIFGKIGIVPRILERYCFSEEYKFTELFEKYRESFLEDLKEQNIFNYYIFKNSNYEIQEDTILLHTEENLFTRARQEEICHFVRTIFAEKFGFDITLSFSYFLPERKPEEIEFVTIENKSAKISELPEISEKMNITKDLKIKKQQKLLKNQLLNKIVILIIRQQRQKTKEIIPIGKNFLMILLFSLDDHLKVK